MIDELPAGAIIDSPEEDVLGCEGDGVMYTGIWLATLDAGFDGSGFVEQLPDLLPPDVRIRTDAPHWPFPALSFTRRTVLVGVSAGALDDGKPYIEVQAFSECGLPASIHTSRDRPQAPAIGIPATLGTALDQHNRLLSADPEQNKPVLSALRRLLASAAER